MGTTGNYSIFGFQQRDIIQGDAGLPFVQGAWSAESFQIKNLTAPIIANDSANKGYVDLTAVRSEFTTKGDLLTFDLGGGFGDEVTRFPAGANNELLIYDSATSSGLKTSNDVVLNQIVVNEIITPKITGPAVPSPPTLEIVGTILASGTATTTVLQIGKKATTTDAQLNFESIDDVSIFLQSDTDDNGSGGALIANSIEGNTRYADTTLDIPTGDFLIRGASESGSNPVDVVFLVDGSYIATTDLPAVSGFTEAFRMSLNDGNVSSFSLKSDVIQEKTTDADVFLNGVIVSNLGITRAQTYTFTTRITLVNTVTITPSQILSGTILSNNTAVSTYTMPTAASLVAFMKNPIVNQTFHFYVLNSGTNTLTFATNTGVTFLNTINTLSVERSAMFCVTLTNITPASEAVEVFGVELFPS